jgi:hypothetical protein
LLARPVRCTTPSGGGVTGRGLHAENTARQKRPYRRIGGLIADAFDPRAPLSTKATDRWLGERFCGVTSHRSA